MSSKPPTRTELREAGTITTFEIVAAIDADMQDTTAGPHRLASRHRRDVAMAMAGSPEAKELLGGSGPRRKAFRNAVAIAAMAACPSANRTAVGAPG